MKTFTAVALLLGLVAMTSSAPAEVEKRAAELPCHIDGQQYDSGTTFSLPGLECIVYQCDDGSTTIIEDGCKDSEGVCHDVGSTWKPSTCVTMQCSKEGNSYRTSIAEMGCQSDNQCYDIGTTWEKKCVTYKCTLTVDPVTGVNTLSTTIDSIKCEDIDGNCHTEDDIFSKQFGGTVYQSCRCVINESTISYSCSG